jgi:signal peptidase II
MTEGQTISILQDFFHITYVKNRGVAFGVLQGKLYIITIISVVAVSAIIFYILKNKTKIPKLSYIAYLFIISGAIGNITDRIVRNFVVDLFDFRGIWKYVFNVADVWINIGVFLMILEYIFDARKKKEKRQEENK